MTDDVKCPFCRSGTVLKTAKKGSDAGKKFYVCIKYPKCKGKVAFDYDWGNDWDDNCEEEIPVMILRSRSSKESIKCPECGSKTRLRIRRRDRREFYVCVRYPYCKGKVEFDKKYGGDHSKVKPVTKSTHDKTLKRRTQRKNVDHKQGKIPWLTISLVIIAIIAIAYIIYAVVALMDQDASISLPIFFCPIPPKSDRQSHYQVRWNPLD